MDSISGPQHFRGMCPLDWLFRICFCLETFPPDLFEGVAFREAFFPVFEPLEFFEWFSCHDRSNRFLCLIRYHFGDSRGNFPSRIIRHGPAEPPSIP
jgi:hypothetical protein